MKTICNVQGEMLQEMWLPLVGPFVLRKAGACAQPKALSAMLATSVQVPPVHPV